MLNGAKKRCQATPILKLEATTINQVIETTIFTVASNEIWLPTSSPLARRTSSSCNPTTQKTITRITASTKYARLLYEPKNLELLPFRTNLVICLMPINVTILIPVAQAIPNTK